MIRFRPQARETLTVTCTVPDCPHKHSAPFYAAYGVPEKSKPAHEKTARWFAEAAENASPHDCAGERHIVAIEWSPFVPVTPP